MAYTIETLLKVVSEAAIASCICFVGFLIFLPSRFGMRALGLMFDKKLEAYKSTQNLAVEKLKEQLNNLTDRGRRSNEKEYSALTSCWEAYVDARLAILQCIVVYLEHPDFNRISVDELESFLTSSEISEAQKDWLRSADNKNKRYADIIKGRSIAVAGQKTFDAFQVLSRNSIFIPVELIKSFESMLGVLSEVQGEQSVNFSLREQQSQPLREATTKFYQSNTADFEDLQSLVRARTLRLD